ncbi:MAG: protein translocase subunit SecF, partial [Mycolicibacterium hassiacum]|uniref:protein translocase subunit SecF n=1 Tax=Mycolicibacterium hassiacum TaxID=46351 RepID=UPI0023F71C53
MARHEKTDTSAAAETTSTAVEAPALKTQSGDTAPQHGFFVRLYTGTGAFEVVGRRKLWFTVSGLIVAVCVASMIFRGFTFGIDFEGGTRVSMPAVTATGPVSVERVEEVFSDTLGTAPDSVVVVGSGDSATVQIRSEHLTNDQIEELRTALFDEFQPRAPDGQPSRQAISDSAVSETWGGEITKKALIALVVFLVIATAYITVRYERYMAAAAMAALGFDLVVTAGVYSIVGFEVTPATVIGLLTILGFSLYDTVIVFDKVEENTHGFEHTTRRTFAEHANLAVNQTFMRSINTSLISVLPIAALMVVAVWLLGVGTLMDLALVQLVGVVVGTYSSIFFATPLLVSLRERTEVVRNHTKRVLRRREGAAAKADAADDEDADDTAESTAVASTGPAGYNQKPAPPTSA